MGKTKSVLLYALTSLAVFILIECDSHPEFICKQTGTNEPMPSFPPAYSTDIRLNFANQQETVELRHYVDSKGKRESLEFFATGRHVKYIVHGEQNLLIKFPSDDFASCSVSGSSTIKLVSEDSGPSDVLQKIYAVTQKTKEFFVSNNGVFNGIYSRKWEGCFRNPKINVSYSFTDASWKNPGNATKDKQIPVSMEAQIDDVYVVGLLDNFQASMPEDIHFQPPEDVFCPDFRSDKKPPTIPDVFSYDSEMIMFDATDEVPLFVSHRSVYYDYPGKISRIDYHDPEHQVEDDPDAKIITKGVAVIHDFNSKILYGFLLPTWKCEVEDFITTAEVVEEKETKDSGMITAAQYFGLDANKISYNGQFLTRGYLADVYTASVTHFDGSDGKSVYTWYFSSVQTNIVANDKVDKNVLLRMVIHPETGAKRRDRIEMNLYNFEKQEPSASVFDISKCYNESLSKLYVITFPANNALRGSESFLKLAVHLALKQFTGLSKQRIFVSEVVFNDQNMFAEFKLLEAPTALKSKVDTKEPSLADAAEKIRKGVEDGSFKLSVSIEEGLITVIPQKDGFNEFRGDRKVNDPSSYGQGSVIGLTIGMLLLGFVLGGVALNLIVSRKFGVSLFQSKGGKNLFSNTVNESNM